MTIHQGDARDPHMIEDGTVATCVESPPYPRQRVYGDSDQEIGMGGTVAEFVNEMVECGKALRPKLVAGGSWWLNLGEKSNGSGGAGGDYAKSGRMAGKPKAGRFADPDYALTQHLGIARKVEEGLQRDGWRVRMTYIWDKYGRGEVGDMRHARRSMLTHEFVLFLAPDKLPTNFRDEWIGDPEINRFISGTSGAFSTLVEPGSVWHFPPGGDKPEMKHLAPFPIELPRRCILLSTRPGDLVLDRFAGSGTTGRAAEMLGRRFVGVDLYANGAPA